MSKNNNNTINPEEIKHFAKLADTWWNPDGPFKPLHNLNPIRLEYIKNRICEHFSRDFNSLKPFEGLRLLDLGCGGGLLTEPMSRLGAEVVGADAAKKNIDIAKSHAKTSGLDIDYIHSTAEELAEWGEKFDIILNMEVIEHVANVNLFMNSCGLLLKNNGVMTIATLNRTMKSWLLAIVGAEYILQWLPKGTHNWKNFIKPSELTNYANLAGFKLKDLSGMQYAPLSNSWKLSKDLSVNYLGFYIKT